jgi:hypothetical protein
MLGTTALIISPKRITQKVSIKKRERTKTIPGNFD